MERTFKESIFVEAVCDCCEKWIKKEIVLEISIEATDHYDEEYDRTYRPEIRIDYLLPVSFETREASDNSEDIDIQGG